MRQKTIRSSSLRLGNSVVSLRARRSSSAEGAYTALAPVQCRDQGEAISNFIGDYFQLLATIGQHYYSDPGNQLSSNRRNSGSAPLPPM